MQDTIVSAANENFILRLQVKQTINSPKWSLKNPPLAGIS